MEQDAQNVIGRVFGTCHVALVHVWWTAEVLPDTSDTTACAKLRSTTHVAHVSTPGLHHYPGGNH